MTEIVPAGKAGKLHDRAVLLSTLWIFVTINYLYCDLIGMMDPGIFQGLMTGHAAGSIPITQGFLLGAAALMEIPMAMIVLSRVLAYRLNRTGNLVAGSFMTIVQAASLFVGTPAPYYLMYSAIEMACTLGIVWCAVRWQDPEISAGSPA